MMSLRAFQQTAIQAYRLYKKSLLMVMPYCILLTASSSVYMRCMMHISQDKTVHLTYAVAGLALLVLNWLLFLILSLSIDSCYRGLSPSRWHIIKQAGARSLQVFGGTLLFSVCFAMCVIALLHIFAALMTAVGVDINHFRASTSWASMPRFEFTVFCVVLGLAILLPAPWTTLYYFVLLLDKKCGVISAFSATFRLVRGNYWRTLFMLIGTVLLVIVLMLLLVVLATILLMMVAAAFSAMTRGAASLGGGVIGHMAPMLGLFIGTLILPLFTSVFLVYYYRLYGDKQDTLNV